MKNLICFLGAFLLMTTSAFSQKKWSLEECVNYAREKNLIIKQADINIESAEVDLKAARWSRLPNLSASSGFNYNFGRNIDPTTNDFVPTNLGYNSWNVSSNMPIYTGGRIETSIAQAQLSMQEANVRKQQTSNDVALDVVIAYLNILFENERLNNNRQQLALAEQNLDRMVKMIEAQAAAPNDRYDLDAQVATNEQNVITSENNVAQALINLKNLLQIDPSEAFDIVRPTINIPSADPTTYTFEEVYSRALQTQPSVAADDLMLQRIEKNIDLAKSSY
ncbi:MAG: TolC family protein, partial [Saprospiraceae bacterium]|nr:TolC family protein [Saprospiraceae bacterium]